MSYNVSGKQGLLWPIYREHHSYVEYYSELRRVLVSKTYSVFITDFFDEAVSAKKTQTKNLWTELFVALYVFGM